MFQVLTYLQKKEEYVLMCPGNLSLKNAELHYLVLLRHISEGI